MKKLPTYGLHKASGQARIYLDGKHYYLGVFGSEESRRRYGELLARHTAGLRIDPVAPSGNDDKTSIAELLMAFWNHAEMYYRTPEGSPSTELGCLKSALRPLRELFEFSDADEFTPLMLKTVRQKYIEAGWTRKSINKHVSRVRSVFRWGVENGLVTVATWQALKALSPLSAGRSPAIEGRQRRAIDDEHLAAVRTRLGERNQDIVDLLLLTGARPGELLSVTWTSINMANDVWVVDLENHKNRHRGKSRRLYFGPKAQRILLKYVDVPNGRRIFPSRRDTLSQAIADACIRAGVPRFVPHELRHTAATRVRDQFGIEAAQATLGHANPDMTSVYAAKLDFLAIQTARNAG